MKNVLLNLWLLVVVVLTASSLVIITGHCGVGAEIGVNLTTNYVSRGVSYSNDRPAVQGFVKTVGENGVGVGLNMTTWKQFDNDSRLILAPEITYQLDDVQFKILYRNYLGEPSINWIEASAKYKTDLWDGISTWGEVSSSPSYQRDDGLMYNVTTGIGYRRGGLFIGADCGYKKVWGDSFTEGYFDRYYSAYIAHALNESSIVELRYSNTMVFVSLKFNAE